MDKETRNLFISVVGTLSAVIAPGSPSEETVAINRQTALVTLSTLAGQFANGSPTLFADIVPVITGKGGIAHPNPAVAASALVCFAMFVRELGPRVVPNMPKFMPTIIDIMQVTFKGMGLW